MSRNTISRITSRIDGLAERLTPNRGPITIVGGDEARVRDAAERDRGGWRTGGTPRPLHHYRRQVCGEFRPWVGRSMLGCRSYDGRELAYAVPALRSRLWGAPIRSTPMPNCPISA
jgi:hypothetical protein